MSMMDPLKPFDDGGPSNDRTLLDWFAGQALSGYFGAPHTMHRNSADQDTAAYLYDMAEAMIAEKRRREAR